MGFLINTDSTGDWHLRSNGRALLAGTVLLAVSLLSMIVVDKNATAEVINGIGVMALIVSIISGVISLLCLGKVLIEWIDD